MPIELQKYQPLWNEWTIGSFLGMGMYSRVYKIQKTDLAGVHVAALKWIPIPTSPGHSESLAREGITDWNAYYRGAAERVQNEIKIMERLGGSSYVVDYKDHSILKREDGPGWDILIRMELLTSLNSYLATARITYRDVVQLGMDITEALKLCQKEGVIHRDIKTANIFRAKSGSFKLGDFGIARHLSNESLTRGIGTIDYMAPELLCGGDYDATVDVYALGIVLYRILNDMRIPFLPDNCETTPEHEAEARQKRLTPGCELPRPRYGCDEMWRIIQRMCAYSPKDRYADLGQLGRELGALYAREETGAFVYPEGVALPIHAISGLTSADNRADSSPDGGTIQMNFARREAYVSATEQNPAEANVVAPPADEAEKKSEKRPIPRSVWWIAAGVILAAALVWLALLLVPGWFSGIAISGVELNASAADIRWRDDAQGPWTVTLTPASGVGQSVLAEEARTQISGLIPGASYTLRVQNDNTGKYAEQALTVSHAGRAPDDVFRRYTCRLMCFSRDALPQDYDYAQGVSGALMRNLDADALTFTNKPVLSQKLGYAYYVLYDYLGAESDIPITVQVVLRYADGSAWQTEAECPRVKNDGSRIVLLDDIFARIWNEKQAWPEGSATLEVYLDGMLYSERTIEIAVSGE